MARSFQYQAKTEAPRQPAAVIAVAIVFAEVIFPRSIIYQAKAEPIVVTEQVTVDEWYKPLSEPVLVKPKVCFQQGLAWSGHTPAAAVTPAVFNSTLTCQVIFPRSIPYQSLASAPRIAETITEDKWHQSWSEPVRVKPKVCFQQPLAWSGHTPAAAVTTAILNTTVTSQVTFPRSVPYQSLAWCPQTIAAPAAVTYFPFVQGDTGLTFQKTIIYQASAEAESPETHIYWDHPWAEPVRPKSRSAALTQTIGLTAVVPVVAVTAVEPTTISSSVSFQRSFIYQSLAWCPQTITPETIREDKWHQPWSQPVRTRKLATAQQRAHFGPEATIPTPAAVTAISTTTLTSQVSFPRSIPYQSLAWCPQTIAAPVATPYFPYVQGDTGLTFQKTIIYQVSAEAASPETHVFWDHPWAEPKRRKSTVHLSDASFWSGFTPAVTPAVTAVSETAATSQVIFPRSIIYQSVAWPPYPVSAEIITEDKWHQAWSQPVRIRRFAVAQQQFLAWSGHTPAAEIITEDKWHQAWSQPVRLKKAVAQQQLLAWSGHTPAAEIIYEDKWHQAWSEPVRIKRIVAQQQFLAWSGHTPAQAQAAVVTIIGSQVFPPRTIIYQSLAWCPQHVLFPESEWHQGWSEPVRFKQGLPAREQQTSAWCPQHVYFTEDRWHQAWSIPVKLKYHFRTDLQQSFTAAPVAPNLQRIIPWYAPLSEPVRQKIGLSARFQSFWTFGKEPPLVPNVTVILDATEINNDIASIFAAVYNQPVRCYVSIKEVPGSDPTYASIEETD